MELLSIALEKRLRSFGLTANEVKLYTYVLQKNGSTISEVAKKMGISSTNVYPISQSLMKKGLVEAELNRPVRFYALALDKALDILIMQHQAKLLNEVRVLQDVKEDMIKSYRSLKLGDEGVHREVERFQILKGGTIPSRLLASLDNVDKIICLFLSKQTFIDLNKTDFMTKLMDSLKDKRFQAKFLLDEDFKNLDIENGNVKFIKTKEINDFIVIDGRELFYYLYPSKSTVENTVLWTNLQSLSTIFHNMFEMRWETLQMESTPEIIDSQSYESFVAMKKSIRELFSVCSLKHKKLITGISGIQHKFDAVIQSGTKIIAVDFIFSQNLISILQILPFYVKIYDLKGLLSKSILFLSCEPDNEAEKFIKDRKIVVKILKNNYFQILSTANT